MKNVSMNEYEVKYYSNIVCYVIKDLKDNQYLTYDTPDCWTDDLDQAEAFENYEDAVDKLDDVIRELASEVYPGDTDEDAEKRLDWDDENRRYFKVIPLYADKLHESKLTEEGPERVWEIIDNYLDKNQGASYREVFDFLVDKKGIHPEYVEYCLEPYSFEESKIRENSAEDYVKDALDSGFNSLYGYAVKLPNGNYVKDGSCKKLLSLYEFESHSREVSDSAWQSWTGGKFGKYVPLKEVPTDDPGYFTDKLEDAYLGSYASTGKGGFIGNLNKIFKGSEIVKVEMNISVDPRDLGKADKIREHIMIMKKSKITESENWYDDMKAEKAKKEGAFIDILQKKHPELKFESQDDIYFAYGVYDTDNNYLGKILLDTHYEFIPKRDCPEEIIKLFKKEGFEINLNVIKPWKESKMKEAFTKNENEITFPGEDLHSRMCEWLYSTADYYDLQDACEVGENPEEMTWNMSDAELADAIQYELENNEDIWYMYTDDDPETSTARRDGEALLAEYNKLHESNEYFHKERDGVYVARKVRDQKGFEDYDDWQKEYLGSKRRARWVNSPLYAKRFKNEEEAQKYLDTYGKDDYYESKINESRDITSNGCIRYINSVLSRYDVMINGKSIYDELLDKFKNKCIDCWTEDYNNNNHNQFYDWLKHNTRTIKVAGLHKWGESTTNPKMKESIEIKGKDLLKDGKVIGEVYSDWVTTGDFGAIVDPKYRRDFEDIYKAVEAHFPGRDSDNGPFIEWGEETEPYDQCTSCGRDLDFGEGYTSRITGDALCQDCYDDEAEWIKLAKGEDKYLWGKKKESKVKDVDVSVDFPISVNNKGRVSSRDAKKLLKHLAGKQMLKSGNQYFIKDSEGKSTCWFFIKSMDPYFAYEFSCEVADEGIDDSGERDYYNCLYIPKSKGKLDLKNAEWESYKV